MMSVERLLLNSIGLECQLTELWNPGECQSISRGWGPLDSTAGPPFMCWGQTKTRFTQHLLAILTQGPQLRSDRAASSINAGCGTAFKGCNLRKDIYYSMRKINKAFLYSISAFGIKIPCFTHLAQEVARMSECCLGLIIPCPQFRHIFLQ